MQSVAVGIARDATALLTSRERIELLRVMMLARATEQRARTLVGRDRDAEPAARWRREPIGAGAASALRRGDRLVAPGRYVSAHLALEESASTGRTSAAPDLLPEAAGVALAVRSRDSHGVVLTLVDEGTMASPRWSESLAVAFERQLPLVVVVERDRPPVSTDAGRATHTPLGEAVDAEDPEAVLAAVRAAAERARGGRGPALVACVTRDAERSPAVWRRGTENITRAARPRDPIEIYARRLVRAGIPRGYVESTIAAAEEEVWT